MPIHLLAGEQATAVATVTAGYITVIKVITGGSGYASEPAVEFSGGGGSGAVAKAILSGDKVGQIIVLNAGSEYSAAPTVVIHRCGIDGGVSDWGDSRLCELGCERISPAGKGEHP